MTPADDLPDRIRELLAAEAVTEKHMFGVLAFLVRGHIVAAAGRGGWLMARADPTTSRALLDDRRVQPMIMSGRPSDAWLRVAPEAIETDEQLTDWVERGLVIVHRLPPKASPTGRGSRGGQPRPPRR